MCACMPLLARQRRNTMYALNDVCVWLPTAANKPKPNFRTMVPQLSHYVDCWFPTVLSFVFPFWPSRLLGLELPKDRPFYSDFFATLFVVALHS